VAKLSFKVAAEARGICEAEILGDCRNRSGRRGIGQDRLRFEEPLALNVSGDATYIVKQPIEIGTGHPDKPAQSPRPQGRCPQMSAYCLAHPLLAAKIDLSPGCGGALGRWGDRGGDNRANSARKPREIGLRDGQEPAL
jgi:hypothetical protein